MFWIIFFFVDFFFFQLKSQQMRPLFVLTCWLFIRTDLQHFVTFVVKCCLALWDKESNVKVQSLVIFDMVLFHSQDLKMDSCNRSPHISLINADKNLDFYQDNICLICSVYSFLYQCLITWHCNNILMRNEHMVTSESERLSVCQTIFRTMTLSLLPPPPLPPPHPHMKMFVSL